jgi:hypothetical protein
MRCKVLAYFRLTKRQFALLAALAALVLVLPASAGAYLYWDVGSGIARADLDGGGVDESFIPNPLPETLGGGIAVSSQFVYFDCYQGLVGRAALDGSDVNPDLFTIPQPGPETHEEHRIAVDAGSLAASGTHLYWSSGAIPIVNERENEAIGRTGIDGGDVEPAFIKTEAPAYSVNVYAGHIYWRTEHAIGRANLDGSDVEQNFILIRSIGIGEMAVAGGHIYWTSHWGHSIGRANIDGRDIDPHFITGLAYPSEIVVGGGYIYWDAEKKREEKLINTGPSWIGRANLDGSGVQQNFISVRSIAGLAVDSLGPGALRQRKHIKLKYKHRRD